MQNIVIRKTVLMAAGALPLLITLPALAQNSAQDMKSEGLEEVVVTAQHREESLQKTPVAVSAFTANTIREQRIESFKDVVQRVPNFYADSVSRTQQSIAMRGAGSLEDSPGSDQAVAMFVDDVYIGENSGLDFDFFDIARVEVLRGPQGTLFGRNVVGGAVNIITQDPTAKPASSAQITYGRFGRFDANAMASGPIIGDNLLAQIAVSSRSSDGYVTNLVTGNKQEQEDQRSLRGKLKFQNGGPFDATLTVNYMRDKSYGIARKLVGDPIPGVPINPDLSVSEQDQDGYYNRKTWGATLKANYNLGFGKVTSITAWRGGNHHATVDIDGAPIPVAEFNDQHNNISQFSQELRLAGSNDRLNWIGGLYYLNVDVRRIEHVFVQGAPNSYIADVTNGGAFPEILGEEIRTKSYAAFGQATYSITNALRLTLGGRFTRERKYGDALCILPGAQCGEVYDVKLSKWWQAFTPKATLDIDITPDILAYATIARGFKSGGFPSNQPDAASAVFAFNPEYAWNYEGGIKARWLENRLQTNVTVYHVDYSDLQVRQINGPFEIVGNAGKARVNGLELELAARPIQALELYANYSFTDAKYKSLFLDGTNYSGNQILLTPRNAATFGGTFTQPIGDGSELALRADIQYKSKTYLDVSNDPNLTAKYNGVVNGSLSWTSANKNWEVSLWGKNLTNVRTMQTGQDYSVFFFSADDLAAGKHAISTTYNPPATYGLSLRWSL